MHFLFLGNYRQPHSTEKYIADALQELGHTVKRLQASTHSIGNLLAEIKSASELVHTANQQVVFLFSTCEVYGAPSGDSGPLITLLVRLRKQLPKVLVACWTFDLMREGYNSTRYWWANSVSEHCHCFFTTDGGLDVPNRVVVRQGYPGPIGIPPNKSQVAGYHHDIIHLGGTYSNRRDWFVKLRDAFGYDFRVIDKGIYNDDLFDVCLSARLVIGPPFPYYDHYWSNRLYVVTGYGGCFTCPTVTGMLEEGWIPHAHYLPLPLNLDAMVRQLKEYLTLTNEQRRKIADTGRSLCVSRFRYTHRCQELVSALNEVP